ncbi:hypothetical protein HD806DRAFT_526081 [Xylariaceae sp. AK1471]|nr:hypothetical protein HD806DRAFT_526081 [Xylariaceae sp. AK1471]
MDNSVAETEKKLLHANTRFWEFCNDQELKRHPEESVELSSVRRIAQCAQQHKMATLWPCEMAWPTEVLEHATYLTKHLKYGRRCVEQAQDQPVPANLVKSMILRMVSLVAKPQNMPDVRSIQETLNMIRNERLKPSRN